MAMHRQSFFEIMASFPSGVAIVTTLDPEGAPRGLTTTAVSSVSAHPPTVLVCVDLGSRTLDALRARRRFVVNFMGQGRSQLCLLFASKADDKFDRVSWRPTETGLPLLEEDVLAWAECCTMHDLEVGDHVILVARVEAGGVVPELESPLMYYRRSWGVWSPTQEPSEEPVAIGDGARAIRRWRAARDLRWRRRRRSLSRPLRGRRLDRLTRACDTRSHLTCHGGSEVRDEVRPLLGDPASPREDSRAAVRGGARADRER